jgi:hypothetical protein
MCRELYKCKYKLRIMKLDQCNAKAEADVWKQK